MLLAPPCRPALLRASAARGRAPQPPPRRAQPQPRRRASSSQCAALASAAAAAAQPTSWQLATTPAERRRLLLSVVKPPLYSAACAPALVGFAAAFYESGVAQPQLLAAFLLSACAVLAWLNLSNDAWDAETGVDAAKAESAVRLLGSPARAQGLAAACLLLGAGGLAALCARLAGAGGGAAGCALAAALACGALYQAPPFRWSYRGRGEPLCFLAFGPLATLAFYAAARGGAGGAAALAPPAAAAVAAALLVGASTTSILFCSHMHQGATDAAAGKRSPVVRHGLRACASALAWAVYGVHAFAVAAALGGALPLPAAAGALAASPAAGAMMRFVAERVEAPAELATAKFWAVRWHAALAMALTLGFALARVL